MDIGTRTGQHRNECKCWRPIVSGLTCALLFFVLAGCADGGGSDDETGGGGGGNNNNSQQNNNISYSTVGWTQFTASADTRIVFVSSSTGDDDNDGLSEQTPKQSIAAGYSLLRSGFPDWLLLRRGDQWFETIGALTKAGRSASEPLLISSYGATGDRPMLLTGNSTAVHVFSPNTPPILNDVAIVGLHFYAHTRDPNHPSFTVPSGNTPGMFILHRVERFLVEDCLVELYGQGVTITGEGAGHIDVRVRRCVVIDSYSTNAHAEGMFFSNCHGLLLEENMLDHNGWNPQVAGAEPNIFRHGIYMYQDNSLATVRGNIIARSASHGCQARVGGLVENNLIVQNSIGLYFTTGGTVQNNVILESKDISPSAPRGLSMEIKDIQSAGATIAYNVIAHDASVSAIGAIAMATNGIGSQNVTIDHNTVYDHAWPIGFNLPIASNIAMTNNVLQVLDGNSSVTSFDNTIDTSVYTIDGNVYDANTPVANWFIVNGFYYSFLGWPAVSGESTGASNDVQFVDPDRSVGSYHGSLGYTATLDAFLSEMRLQAKHNWRPDYMAQPVNDYIRAGFEPLEDLGANDPGVMAFGGGP